MLHGTTIATNIVIEHNGAEVGMITTEGYRDILHIARHKKPLQLLHLPGAALAARPLVKRRHRLTVAERITVPDGAVLVAARRGRGARAGAEAEGGRASRRSRSASCSRYLNPEHEPRVAEIVREEFPEAFLSVSLGGAAAVPRVRALLDRLR